MINLMISIQRERHWESERFQIDGSTEKMQVILSFKLVEII